MMNAPLSRVRYNFEIIQATFTVHFESHPVLPSPVTVVLPGGLSLSLYSMNIVTVFSMCILMFIPSSQRFIHPTVSTRWTSTR